jgi:hypothetical protein
VTDGSGLDAGPWTTWPVKALKIEPWHGQCSCGPPAFTVQPMCVQTALNAATVPAEDRARVTGLPACVAAMEPPTGIADTVASAPVGGTRDDDGRGAGAAAALECGGVECGGVECGGVECGGVEACGVEACGVECGVGCGVECGGAAGEPACGVVDRVASAALGWLVIPPLLGAALGASALAVSGAPPVPHPAKASAAMPANPAPPPRTARRLISVHSDMVMPPVSITAPGPRSGLTS